MQGTAKDLIVSETKKAAAVYYRKRITALYKDIGGEKSQCFLCGKTIWWVKAGENKQRSPYTMDGYNHYKECPESLE